MRLKMRKLAVTCVIALLCVPATWIATRGNNDSDIARNLEIFNSLYKELNAFYVDSIDANKTIEDAIDYTYSMKQRKSQNLILVSMNAKAVIRLSDTPLGKVLKSGNLNY